MCGLNAIAQTLGRILGIAAIFAATLGVPVNAADVHVVRKGENLTLIAKRYGVSMEAVARVNHISDTNHLVAGQRLTIPSVSYELTDYVVKKGDSLGAIAMRLGLPVNSLMRYNEIDDPDEIRVGQVLKLPVTEMPDLFYTVQRGDTLEMIAHRYGLSTSTLARYNGLDRPDIIVVGQKLKIPHGRQVIVGPQLGAAVFNKLERTHVNRGKWRYIVIHHSATNVGNPKSMDAYHRRVRHMENGLAYHFVIGNGRGGMENGEIYIGQRWLKQLNGGHLAKEYLNAKSIGICLVGDFTHRKPSSTQLRQLHALTVYLMQRCNIPKSRIKTHRQIHPGHTLCPGKYFPIKDFLDDLP